MESNLIPKRYSLAQGLPIRPTNDLSKSIIDGLRSAVDDYCAMVDSLKSSFMFFLENVSAKYEDSAIAFSEEIRQYKDIVDLFTFNHFDLKLEVADFEAKQSGVLTKLEELLDSAGRGKNDLRSLKNNYGSSNGASKTKEFEDLKAKVTKLKHKNDKMKKVIRDWRIKYQDLLKQLETMETQAKQTAARKKTQPSFEDIAFNSCEKPKSVNDVGWLNNRNQVNINKSFQFMPEERAMSKYAYNPNNQPNERHSSSVYVKRRATFGDIRMSIEDLSEQNGYRENLSRQNDEIDMLNREIELLKKELHQKSKEKSMLVDGYEKSLKFEKETAGKVINNLRKNIQIKEEKEIERLSVVNFNPMNSQKTIQVSQNVNGDNSFMNAGQKSLISQLEKKKRTLQTLRSNLDNLLKEKQMLKNQVSSKNKQVEEMINKIALLENSNQKIVRDCSDLEMTNSQLTSKFLGAIERENNLLRQFNALKVKLRAYEKVIEEIKQDTG